MDQKIQGAVGQIARIRELANAWLEKEIISRAIEGLQPAHGSVLAFLFRQNTPVPIKDIVESVRRVKSTVTGMVNTLARYGFVCKTSCPEDGRVVYVELTNKGRSLQKDFEQISSDLLATFYGEMSQKDRQSLVRLLDQLESNLESDCSTERS